MTIKGFFSLKENKFFWLNIAAMIVTVVVLCTGVLFWLDEYTHHGEAVEVPDVKGLKLEDVSEQFTKRGLFFTVSDSSYVKALPAGCILDYNPSAGQKVKKGRTIYLTINNKKVPLQRVPDVADNSSLRQAEARLLAVGFKLDSIQWIGGERDWVYGVKYKGHELSVNAEVPMGATLTLMVGNGGEAIEEFGDSINVEEPITTTTTESSEDDDSWF